MTDDPVGELAHLITGTIASNCCFRTGGRDRKAKRCDCRTIAEDLIEYGGDVIEIIKRARDAI